MRLVVGPALLAILLVGCGRQGAAKVGVQAVSARVTESAVEPGGMLHLTGHHLGSTAGSVALLGITRSGEDCAVTAWSDVAITCRVPNDAVSGLVAVAIPGGHSVGAGQLTVLGPATGVARLEVAGPRRGTAGDVATFVITARDDAGRPFPRASIEMLAGIRRQVVQTDGKGICHFSLVFFGTHTIAFSSGHASAEWTYAALLPADEYVSLVSSPRSAPPGTPLYVTARLTDARGRPVGGAAVRFKVYGPPQIRLSTSTAMTDSRGEAFIRAQSALPGPAVISAVSNHGFAQGNVQVTWQGHS